MRRFSLLIADDVVAVVVVVVAGVLFNLPRLFPEVDDDESLGVLLLLLLLFTLFTRRRVSLVDVKAFVGVDALDALLVALDELLVVVLFEFEFDMNLRRFDVDNAI